MPGYDYDDELDDADPEDRIEESYDGFVWQYVDDTDVSL